MAYRKLPSDLQAEKVPKEKLPYSHGALIRGASHSVYATSSMVSFAVCCSRVSTANHSIVIDFLSSKCVHVVNHSSPQSQQFCTSVSINNRLSHALHASASSQDTTFCTKYCFHGRLCFTSILPLVLEFQQLLQRGS